jgi:glycerol-3-phosphate acyltransferase PlsX
LAALLLGRGMSALKLRLDPAQYNGAYLLGLNGVAVKSHGGAGEIAFASALDVAIDAAKHNLPQVLSPILQDMIDNNHSVKTN